MFARIGAEAFTERARGELLATGETIRKRAADVPDELTAQERQIARRARDGQSNSEIGAELFLSPRTVEWHLRKVFTKLLGHASITTTLSVYGHLTAEDARKALQAAGWFTGNEVTW